MTSVFPVDGTKSQKIKYLQRQIKELKQQKICYNKMIKQREKVIRKLDG